jgi:hypothetical protein
MRCRRIPIQGIGERGDIIRMEKEHTCECCKKESPCCSSFKSETDIGRMCSGRYIGKI